MTEENYGFCPRCGAKLHQTANFCPECGNILNDDAAPQGMNPNAYFMDSRTGKDRPMGGMFLFAFILLVIYSVYSISEGIYLIVDAEGIVDLMNWAFNETYGMDMIEFLAQEGLNYTEAEFISSIRLMGALSLVSGLFALVATVLCYMRRRRKIVIGVIIAGSLVLIISAGLLNVAAGLLVAYFVYRSPEYFID